MLWSNKIVMLMPLLHAADVSSEGTHFELRRLYEERLKEYLYSRSTRSTPTNNNFNLVEGEDN
jgi:hypothetical protein